MTLIKSINRIKNNTPIHIPYIIVIDDKIVHVSKPLIKILKQDPTGMSIGTFLAPDAKEELNQRGYLEEGKIKRNLKLGQQIIDTDFEISNQKIESKVLSYVIVKKMTIQEDIKAAI